MIASGEEDVADNRTADQLFRNLQLSNHERSNTITPLLKN